MSGHYHIPKPSDFERHEGVDLTRLAAIKTDALVKALEAVAAARMPGEARKIAVEALRAHVGGTSQSSPKERETP